MRHQPFVCDKRTETPETGSLFAEISSRSLCASYQPWHFTAFSEKVVLGSMDPNIVLPLLSTTFHDIKSGMFFHCFQVFFDSFSHPGKGFFSENRRFFFLCDLFLFRVLHAIRSCSAVSWRAILVKPGAFCKVYYADHVVCCDEQANVFKTPGYRGLCIKSCVFTAFPA